MADSLAHVVDTWDGDYTELVQFADELDGDEELCNALFASRGEAYSIGLWIGRASSTSATQPRAAGGSNPLPKG